MRKLPKPWVLRVVVPCGECEGCGKVMVVLRGGPIMTTKPCHACGGFGSWIKTIKLSAREARRIDEMASAHGVRS